VKVGDKIFCNKDYLIDSEILFKKNKYYEIIDVYYVSDYKEHFGGFFTKRHNNLIPSMWVSVQSEDDNLHRNFSMIEMSLNYIWEFFNHKEVLNKKLKKIRLS